MPETIEKTSVVPAERPSALPPRPPGTSGAKRKHLARLALPSAVVIALLVHLFASKNQASVEARPYFIVLGAFLITGLAIAAMPFIWSPQRHWIQDRCPILAAAVLSLGIWELVTSGFHWLPMPYFPGPAGVLGSLISDRALLFDSTWHSLLLLLSGYVLGATIAFITGLCIGWSARAHYWVMPLLKFVGPIPATAWIPLAMVLAPSAVFSAVALIALAVWFPVTMLTASGVSNTRASYLDVARTLGARPSYLILHVAIPAAMPSIFIGLFMGLGPSFLPLFV